MHRFDSERAKVNTLDNILYIIQYIRTLSHGNAHTPNKKKKNAYSSLLQPYPIFFQFLLPSFTLSQ